jgi:hypothetical protein
MAFLLAFGAQVDLPPCILHLALFIAPFLKTRSNNSSAFKGTADMAQELADFCL